MSFEEQLDESQSIASIRSQLHGDRGSLTLLFGGGTAALMTVPHNLGVRPGVVNVIVVNPASGPLSVYCVSRNDKFLNFMGVAAAPVATDPIVEWEARG